MPVTILEPTTGQLFGPGWGAKVSTDRIGPEPDGTLWDMRLQGPPGEDLILWVRVPFVTPQRTLLAVQFLGESANVTPLLQAWASGEPASLTVRLIAPDTTVLEQATVNVVLDRTQGQAAELDFLAVLRHSTIANGLTEEQSESLQIVQASVGSIGPVGRVQSVGGLLDALSAATQLEIGRLTDPPMDLTGDGVLELDELLTIVWGVYWVADIPVGIGRLHGQTVEYQQRLVQWRTVHEIDGVELVTEVLDANYHGFLWTIQKPGWVRVEYSVTPGVTIHAQWWVWP